MTILNNSKDPHFIYIGAGKCGSTSLSNYLNQHPETYICPKKETFFFLPEKIRNNHKTFGAILTLEDYRKLFQSAPPNACIGEISTNYYAYPKSAKLIQSQLPKVKLLATLRNPADRAFSAYQMFVRAGHEKKKFQDLIASNIKYIKRGFYYSQLAPFFEIFNKEKINVCLYEDLCKKPIAFMHQIFEFLEIDDSFIPNMAHRGRVGGLPKNQMLNDLLIQKNPIRAFASNTLKPFFSSKLRQKIRSTLIKKNIQKVRLDSESRQRLMTIYREDILRLQNLIDKDLSIWFQEN